MWVWGSQIKVGAIAKKPLLNVTDDWCFYLCLVGFDPAWVWFVFADSVIEDRRIVHLEDGDGDKFGHESAFLLYATRMWWVHSPAAKKWEPL